MNWVLKCGDKSAYTGNGIRVTNILVWNYVGNDYVSIVKGHNFIKLQHFQQFLMLQYLQWQ